MTLPEWAGDRTVREHAATGHTGGVLSHSSALTAHGAVQREARRLDVTVRVTDRLRSTPRLRIHRSRRPCGTTIVRGLAVPPFPPH